MQLARDSNCMIGLAFPLFSFKLFGLFLVHFFEVHEKWTFLTHQGFHGN